MAFIRTVLGDIAPSELGLTYHHEHLLAHPPAAIVAADPDLLLDSAEAMVDEIGRFQALGGRAICDATAIDYGRDIRGVADIAARTGVHVIATTGFNKGLFFSEEIVRAPLDALEQRVYDDVAVGIDGTSWRAGQVKFGSSYGYMSPVEEKCARAVCRAQKRLGAPLFTHTEAGTMALEQLALLREEGVSLEKVCIGHLDRNPDLWLCRQVARTGAYVSLDQWSKVKYYPDSVRVELLLALIEAGYERQVLLSGDLARRSYLRAYEGGPGFAYIVSTVVPRLQDEMREAGWLPSRIEAVIETLLVENPARYFTLDG